MVILLLFWGGGNPKKEKSYKNVVILKCFNFATLFSCSLEVKEGGMVSPTSPNPGTHFGVGYGYDQSKKSSIQGIWN